VPRDRPGTNASTRRSGKSCAAWLREGRCSFASTCVAQATESTRKYLQELTPPAACPAGRPSSKTPQHTSRSDEECLVKDTVPDAGNEEKSLTARHKQLRAATHAIFQACEASQPRGTRTAARRRSGMLQNAPCGLRPRCCGSFNSQQGDLWPIQSKMMCDSEK
jgi:hypothetical protein